MGRDIQYIMLEETLNNLLLDPYIRQRRNALVSFVKARLLNAVLSRWAQMGISKDMEASFADPNTDKKTAAALLTHFQNTALELGLSKRKVQEFHRIAGLDRTCALEELKQMLLEMELIHFRKQNNLSAKVWLDFLNCTVLPGASTLEVLRKGLKLKPAEVEEFNALVIRDVFYVDEALYSLVHSYVKRTGMSSIEFYNHACIGKDAWDAFYHSKTPGLLKKTSQSTLLKLSIGFALEEPEAWDFMNTAGSTFVVRRDLVFLACIRCRYADPSDVEIILDFFSQDDQGQTYYKNPYSGYWS